MKQINLTWSFTGSSLSGLKIARSTNGKSCSQIATISAGSVSYLNTGLRTGNKYYYRMRAYTASANSAYSNTVAAVAKQVHRQIAAATRQDRRNSPSLFFCLCIIASALLDQP